jgi:hypothetical protein
MNIPVLAEAATASGFVTSARMRAIPARAVEHKWNGRYNPNLALAVLMQAHRRPECVHQV